MEENKEPRNKPMNMCSAPFINNAAKNTQWGNDGLFKISFWENWIVTICKRMKLNPILHHSEKKKKKPQNGINLKWNIRPKTVKLLKENIEGKL